MGDSAVSPAIASLTGIMRNYAACLALGRAYLSETPAETPAEELDLDRLENFLSARADLLAEAAHSFEALKEEGWEEEEERRELARRTAAVLEEMTELENGLARFLSERLSNLGETIGQLRRIAPAFQRYGHLGGDRAEPSFLTRHE